VTFSFKNFATIKAKLPFLRTYWNILPSSLTKILGFPWYSLPSYLCQFNTVCFTNVFRGKIFQLFFVTTKSPFAFSECFKLRGRLKNSTQFIHTVETNRISGKGFNTLFCYSYWDSRCCYIITNIASQHALLPYTKHRQKL